MDKIRRTFERVNSLDELFNNSVWKTRKDFRRDKNKLRIVTTGILAQAALIPKVGNYVCQGLGAVLKPLHYLQSFYQIRYSDEKSGYVLRTKNPITIKKLAGIN